MSRSIKFVIPMIPPSVNSLYNVIRQGSSIRVEMKPEIRLWKTQAKLHVPAWKATDAGFLYFNADIYMQTMCKNGKLKRHDLQNLEKCLIDSICEKLGIGDEFIFKKQTRKIESERERVEVEMGLLDDATVQESVK